MHSRREDSSAGSTITKDFHAYLTLDVHSIRHGVACDRAARGLWRRTVRHLRRQGPNGEGTIALDFQKENKVKMTAHGPLGAVTFDCTYVVDGDKVTITMPMGGDTLVMMKKGSNYEATKDGETVVFVKK
jgi:hypothetical protein